MNSRELEMPELPIVTNLDRAEISLVNSSVKLAIRLNYSSTIKLRV